MDQPSGFDFMYNTPEEANAGQRSNEAPFQGAIAADPGGYPLKPHYSVDPIGFVQPWDARDASTVPFPFVPPVLDQRFNPSSVATSIPYGEANLISEAFGSNLVPSQWSAHYNVHHGDLLTSMPAFASADISHGFEAHTVDRSPTGQLNPSNFQSHTTLDLPRNGFDANQQSNPVKQTPPNVAVLHAARPSNTWFEPGGVTAMLEKPIRTALDKRSSPLRPTSKRGQASSRTKVTKRGRQLNEDEKADAAAMRRLGVCVRCRLFHVKCNQNNPCSKCIKSGENPRSFTQLCVRMELNSIHLVRHGFGRFNQHDVKFIQYHWIDAYSAPQNLSMEWALPGGKKIFATQYFKLPVRRYSVNESYVDTDTTDYHWSSGGEEKTIKVPPFACDDDKKVVAEIPSFLERSRREVEEWIAQNDRDDEIAQITYAEARRFSRVHGSDLIDEALALQCGTIISQGVGSVCTESLPLLLQDADCDDISKCVAYDGDDAGHERPLPFAVQHQIEVAILQYINRKQGELLKKMHQRFYQRNPKPWYEIFLAFYILLKNLEWIYSGALRYKRACEKTMLESQVNGVIRQMVKEYKYAAKVMFYHFRFILLGPVPFKVVRDRPAALQHQLGLDDKASLYLQHLVALLDKNELMEASPIAKSVDSFDGPPNGIWIFELFRALS